MGLLRPLRAKPTRVASRAGIQKKSGAPASRRPPTSHAANLRRSDQPAAVAPRRLNTYNASLTQGIASGAGCMAQSRNSSLANSDASRLLADGFRFLRFPEPLESEFRTEHRARLRGWNRIAIWVAACTVTGFAILDHFVLSAEHARITNMVRFGIQVPAVILMLLCTSQRF